MGSLIKFRGQVLEHRTNPESLEGATVTPYKSYREIPLTRGQFVLVDDSDYEQLTTHKWKAEKTPSGFKATRNQFLSGRKYRGLIMSRVIMGLELGDKRVVDHINGNTLDNRRCNLRICEQRQNMMNQGRKSTNKSGFKGVCWNRHNKRWVAQICLNYKQNFLGYFDTPEEAHAAYCEAVVRFHGEFARTA